MEKLTRSQTYGLFVVIVLLLGVLAFYAIQRTAASSTSAITVRDAPTQLVASAPTTPSSPPANVPASMPSTIPTAPPAEIVIHVAGAVKKPGVYHLKPDARNQDALEAAGGPTANANTDSVNLAAHIQDGTQLYIPTHKEQPTGGAPETTATAPTDKSANVPASHASSAKPAEKGGKSDKLTDPSQGQINLNTASAEQLQRVPGIGPSTAERILAFRKENGGFKTAEDLLQISGIGERKFEKMKPFVRVR